MRKSHSCFSHARISRISSISFHHSVQVCLNSAYFRSQITSNAFHAIKIKYFYSTNIMTSDAHEFGLSKSNLSIGESVISKNTHLWDNEVETFVQKNLTLHEILREYGHLSPETTRPFWRVHTLNPTDFFKILVGSVPDAEDSKKVTFLWNLFRWASNQCSEFQHLPEAVDIMTRMLIRARMFDEAETLLFSGETREVFIVDGLICCEIIEGYIKDSQLDKAFSLYDRGKYMNVAYSGSCYRALLNVLIKMGLEELVVRIYKDMIDDGLWSYSENHFTEFVVGQLSKAGKTLEAINIIENLKGYGVQISSETLSKIVEAYGKKNYYEDLFYFMKEWNHIPENPICNKIISSLCMNLGTENAWLFVEALEDIGFKMDSITVNILISHSCRQRKLKNALSYLSESSSRKIEVEVDAYNAIIIGLFKEGMYSSVRNVHDEMVNAGLIPNLSTYKSLMAGYCKYRKFDEAKEIFGEMINRGIASISPTEDTLTKIFQMIGIDHLNVKVKRDNNSCSAKAEFFDALGNGLYLDTNIEEYDRLLEQVMDNGFSPDFDSLILKECYKGDINKALSLKGEACQWEKNISLSTYTKIVEVLCKSSSNLNVFITFITENAQLLDCIGSETLNLVTRYLSENGVIMYAILMLNKLLKEQMPIDCETYTAVLLQICKDEQVFMKENMIKDVLKLFECMVETYPYSDSIAFISEAITKKLCGVGFIDTANAFVERMICWGHSISNESYSNLIEGFIKERSFRSAFEIIDRLLEENMTFSASIFSIILPYVINFGGIQKVLSLKKNMLNAQSETSSVYNILVNGLCQLGYMNEARVQLHEMLRNETSPNQNVLNELIRGFCHVNSSTEVLETLGFMLRNGINLSIIGYRSLVHQFCSHGQLHKALGVAKLICEKCKPDLLIFHNVLIFYLFQSRNGLLVDAALKKMITEGNLVLDQDTYNFLIHGYYKRSNTSRAVKLLNTMIAEGMKPNGRSLRAVMCYLCDNGEVYKALDLSRVIQSNHWKFNSVVIFKLTNAIMLHYGNLKAEFFLDQIEKNNLIAENVNFDLLIKKFCMHGCVNRAIHLLNLMLKKGHNPNETSYNLVIKGLTICKLFDQALDFHAEMLQKSLHPSLDSCNTLVFGLCEVNRTEDASMVLRTMVRVGCIPTADMYNCVINRYHAQNDTNSASELMNEMQKVGYSPNFETYWSLISNLNSGEEKKDGDGDEGFLSRLLSGNGVFSSKKTLS